MNWNEMMGKRFVIVLVLGAIVSAVMVNGCLGRAGPGGGGIPPPPRRAGRFRGKAAVSMEVAEKREAKALEPATRRGAALHPWRLTGPLIEFAAGRG